MGLTSWEGRRIRKSDALVAKNYLNEEELRALNNLAEQYLIFAEGQATRRIAMTMQDWIIKLEGFLTLNDRDILYDAGKVSAQVAKAHSGQTSSLQYAKTYPSQYPQPAESPKRNRNSSLAHSIAY